MDFPRFSFLYDNYKAYIPIVSFPQCCCSRISLLLHRPDFHHWIWGPDSKDTVGQGFTPGIIELERIDFINFKFPAGDNHNCH